MSVPPPPPVSPEDSNPAEPTQDHLAALPSWAHPVERRTLVQGAAWSIPVIAVAVGAPLAAASPTPTLTFTNGPYAVSACDTLNPVILNLTTDGTAPDAGKVVTVSLPDGLTWSDGTTTPRPFTTDASGNITLTGLKAISGSTTTGTITAVSDTGPSATTTVAVTAAIGGGAAFQLGLAGGTVGYPGIPVDAVSVGGQYFLRPNGDLWFANGGTTPGVVATGVTSAVGYTTGSGTPSWVNYNSSTGAAFQLGLAGGTVDYPGIPADAVSVGGQYFLRPNGDLWFGNGGVTPGVVATGVTSAVGYTGDNGTPSWVNYNSSTGAAWETGLAGGTVDYPGIPADAVSVGGQYFLRPNGDLWFGNGGVTPGVVATGVASAVGYTTGSGTPSWVNYNSSTGAAWKTGLAGGTVDYPDIPADAVSVGGQYFLRPNGDLWFGNGGVTPGVVATGVASAVGYTADNGTPSWVNYNSAPVCA